MNADFFIWKHVTSLIVNAPTEGFVSMIFMTMELKVMPIIMLIVKLSLNDLKLCDYESIKTSNNFCNFWFSFVNICCLRRWILII